MRKYITLVSILSLAACGGGSGGGDGLTPAEHLFGVGIGTGQTPSHLVPREDGNGFEILSFGAWGNVYEITPINGYGTFEYLGEVQNPENLTMYAFTGQQNLQMAQWGYAKDASVSNAVFTGPAVMLGYHNINQSNHVFHVADSSDYGTVKIKYGYDISNPPSIEFVMSNPENNLTTTSATINFSEDRNNVRIWTEVRDDNDWNKYKSYTGYGHKN